MINMMNILLAVIMILNPIIVGPQGDYQSFTEAVYNTVDSGRPIIVQPGTYDIKAEYEQLFGKQQIENMPYTTDLNMFQWGIQIKNRIIYFMPGSKLICKWDLPTDFSSRFSPLYLVTNATLIGLDLYAEGTMYAIHDDVWNIDDTYINEYHYCKVIGKNLFNTNCIGGGAGKHSRHIIDNCYFDNGVPHSVTVRYHNNTFPDSIGDIFISNSYFNAKVAFSNWGPPTNELNVYINNCTVEEIINPFEGEEYHHTNVNIYKWGELN